MDPNETLKRLRALSSYLSSADEEHQAGGCPMGEVHLRWAAEMAEKFEALDHWLTRKGFLPSAWERK